jgi:thymidine phosphorylase
MTLHTDTPATFEAALRDLDDAWQIAPDGSRPPARPLMIERVAVDG